jgi:hypothetical protein
MGIQAHEFPLDPLDKSYRDLLLGKGFRWVTIRRRSAPGEFVSMHKWQHLAERAAQPENRLVVDLAEANLS